MQVTITRGAALIVTAVVWGAIACGGQTETGDGDGDNEGGTAGASGGSGGGASGSGASGRGGSGSSGGPTTPLGECKMGTRVPTDPEQPCAWVGNNLCYDTKEAACACICPRDRKSTCISSLPGGPTDRVLVDCY
jgi:hypothetical protein